MPGYRIGIGSVVEIGRTVANTTTFTALAGVKDITLPESTVDEIEITNMDSPNRTKEFMAGLNDNGEISLEMLWEPESATDDLLLAIKETGETVQIRFDIVGTTTPETYAGFLKGYTRTAPVSAELNATATFRISAKIA